MELKSHDEQDARVQEIYARWLDIGIKAGIATSTGRDAGLPVRVPRAVHPDCGTMARSAPGRPFLALDGAPPARPGSACSATATT